MPRHRVPCEALGNGAGAKAPAFTQATSKFWGSPREAIAVGCPGEACKNTRYEVAKAGMNVAPGSRTHGTMLLYVRQDTHVWMPADVNTGLRVERYVVMQ